MDDLILDVITEAHRDNKKMRSICPICKTRQVEWLSSRRVRCRLSFYVFVRKPQWTLTLTVVSSFEPGQ